MEATEDTKSLPNNKHSRAKGPSCAGGWSEQIREAGRQVRWQDQAWAGSQERVVGHHKELGNGETDMVEPHSQEGFLEEVSLALIM